MKAHGVKQQRATAKKKLQRSLRAVTAKHERALKKLEKTNLGNMKQMVERLGLSEAAKAAAVETDSPTLFGAEPPAV